MAWTWEEVLQLACRLLIIAGMSRVALIAFGLSFAGIASGAPMPLTNKDIGLMLRTGYSSATILQELANRKCAEPLSAAQETQLMNAGASPELILALKGGRYALSAADLAQIQQKKEIEAKRRAAALEESRKSSTLYQAQQAQNRAIEATRQKLIYQALKGDLVTWHNGAVSRFDDSALENKKLFLIYFSAHWCNPCRLFTPGLVNYYNEMAAKHPEFDVIFVSRDKSTFGMETYMREANMPWPAIDYQKISAKVVINKYAGQGIPDLVLVDGSGKILADSYNGQQYVGPAKVLETLDKMLNGTGPQVAQAH